jgi:hypothetical protein
VAAGALLGLAVNSNPIIVALAMAIVGGWGIWELSTRRWRIVVDGALVLAGIVGVSLFGVLYFWYRFDQPDIFTPSIDAARHWALRASRSVPPTTAGSRTGSSSTSRRSCSSPGS